MGAQVASYWVSTWVFLILEPFDEGDIYVKFLLRNKSDGFKFNLYTVYGPAQQQNKEVFLTELARICSHETLPYIIGGDFNIMSMNLFNAVIQAFDLKEIYMSGHLYTWAGPGDDPTYKKIGSSAS